MFQVTFSEQSMRELNQLDKLAQLELIDPISSLKPADLANPREPLGRFHRGEREYYRIRSGDYRFYFEVKGETLLPELQLRSRGPVNPATAQADVDRIKDIYRRSGRAAPGRRRGRGSRGRTAGRWTVRGRRSG